MIYCSDGRIYRRRIGFSENPFEVIPEDSTSSENLIDLIGEQVSYWSETEEKIMNRREEPNV